MQGQSLCLLVLRLVSVHSACVFQSLEKDIMARNDIAEKLRQEVDSVTASSHPTKTLHGNDQSSDCHISGVSAQDRKNGKSSGAIICYVTATNTKCVKLVCKLGSLSSCSAER